ncbi:hypothetical protein [Paenibacillus sp. MY03]|jgi:threonine dehydrogenase-like Zn-dependent dehydrogenase|uniref:hypothetical protein n=1 Tax=Paenibacillus sp. MY03 TaxID=302980 RepID=UPI0015C5F8A3|nr:hypothetical protein [Paenibacillus sp. MY03]
MGAARVIGMDINEERMEWERSLGFGEVMHPDELAQHQVHLGYECVGAAAALQI